MSKYLSLPLGPAANFVSGVIRVYNSADKGFAEGHTPGIPPLIQYADILSNVDQSALDGMGITQGELDTLVSDANSQIDTPDCDSVIVIEDNQERA